MERTLRVFNWLGGTTSARSPASGTSGMMSRGNVTTLSCIQMGLGASSQCEKGTIRLGATGSDGSSRTPHAKRQGNPLAFRWLALC